MTDECWNCGKTHEGPCDDDSIYGWLPALAYAFGSLITIAVLALTGGIA